MFAPPRESTKRPCGTAGLTPPRVARITGKTRRTGHPRHYAVISRRVLPFWSRWAACCRWRSWWSCWASRGCWRRWRMRLRRGVLDRVPWRPAIAVGDRPGLPAAGAGHQRRRSPTRYATVADACLGRRSYARLPGDVGVGEAEDEFLAEGLRGGGEAAGHFLGQRPLQGRPRPSRRSVRSR